MYLRIIRCHLKEDADPRETVTVFDEIVPAIEAYPGFKGTSLMYNEQNRTLVAFIYWETEEHAGDAGEALRPLLFECTWEVTDEPLDISGFDVLRHSVNNIT